MILLCEVIIVIFAAFPWTECLLNPGTISGGHQDKLVTELIQNVSRLNQAFDAAAAREQTNMANLIKENIQLHKNVSKLQRTIADQQQRLDHLEKEKQQLDNRMNQSFGAYQLMLQDIVDKHNQQTSLINNQSVALNQDVANLGKQFHYLSLSLSDTEKKCTAINASLMGMYFCNQQITSE